MNTTAFDSAIQALMQHTRFLPGDQVMGELQLIQERLKFMPNLLEGAPETIAASLHELLQGDISPEMLAAIVEMTGQTQFDVVRANADLFLEACQRTLSSYQELVVTVAVPLNSELKLTIANQIQQRFKQPVRVIFQTNPAIIAGCIIHEPDGQSFDYSLHSAAMPLARQWIKHQLTQGGQS